jgi:hypothetical protein
VRFQVLTAASIKFRIVFWDVMPCKIIVDRGTCYLHDQGSSLMVEAARTSETSVDNYFTRKYISQKTILNFIERLCFLSFIIIIIIIIIHRRL